MKIFTKKFMVFINLKTKLNKLNSTLKQILKIFLGAVNVHTFVHKSTYAYRKANRQKKKLLQGFPGGAVVKNPPANAGHTGSSPGPGRSHMPQSN